MINLIYLILAILGLSFLIFIHELGHYFMARRAGMRVDTFSIGFGRPIFAWKMDGVKWQIGWLPFGGFVRIAGMESDKAGVDPYQIRDGFFGKSPLERIKVAFMGPFVNIIFALLVFALLWVGGGREKNFSDFTEVVGWVDPKSDAYHLGLRPGDEIVAYNDRPFQGAKDHLYTALTSSSPIDIKGNKINYATDEKSTFDIKVQAAPHPNAVEKGVLTTGITQSASYLIYNKLPGNRENPLPSGSPLKNSGIQYGDRIVWVDGQLVFSLEHLLHILNDNRSLLTIQRGGKALLARTPRIPLQELRMDPSYKEELIDWQYEAELNAVKFQKLLSIPYYLTNEGVVVSEIKFIDRENEKEAFPPYPLSPLELPLQPGDRIIAVEGVPVKHSSTILKQLQTRDVLVIVERSVGKEPVISWKEADRTFEHEIDPKDLEKIVASIGTDKPVKEVGNLYLLNPITPKTRRQILTGEENQEQLVGEQEQKREIEAIEDPEKRSHLLNLIENREKQLMLGLPGVQDKKVLYNPIPTDLFSNVFQEIWRTLVALFTGTLNPKWMSGPIGIIQVVQEQWKLSFGDALFWLGAISLNLGILNLLPIPMLDGGTILLSLFEMVTGKQIKPKTMEKLILPFAILLIVFFVFLTYNDLSRIFGGFLHW